MRLVSDVWSENTALFERLMEIHSNPPMALMCDKAQLRRERSICQRCYREDLKTPELLKQ